jgi:hypothetical protein
MGSNVQLAPLSGRARQILNDIEREARDWEDKVGKRLLQPTRKALELARAESSATPILQDRSATVANVKPEEVAAAFHTTIAGTRDHQ